MNHLKVKRTVGTFSIVAAAGVLMVAFQNCAPTAFDAVESGLGVGQKVVYSGSGFLSSDFTSDTPNQTVSAENRIPESLITSGASSATSSSTTPSVKIILAPPTFGINKVDRVQEGNKHYLDVTIVQQGSGMRFYGLDMESDAYYPVYVQRYHFNPSVNRSPHALDPVSAKANESGGVTAYSYRLPITDYALQTGRVVVSLDGQCDVSNGVFADNVSKQCRSNSVAVNLKSAEGQVQFSGPSQVYYGEALSSPFDAKGITGVFAGCNLEDRSGGLGSSPTGKVEDCRWLTNPSGWTQVVAGTWRHNQPFQGNGTIYAQFVVADIVNGQVKAVSPVLKVVMQSR